MSFNRIATGLVLFIGVTASRGQVTITAADLQPPGNAAWTAAQLGVGGLTAFKLIAEETTNADYNSFLLDASNNGFPGSVGTTSDDTLVFLPADGPGKIATLIVPSGTGFSLFHDITNATGLSGTGPDGVLDVNDAYVNSNPAFNFTRVGAVQLVKYYLPDPAQTYQYTEYGVTTTLSHGFSAFIFIEEDHKPNFDYNDMIVGVMAGCSQNSDCDDGLFCNGVESCVGGVCRGGQPPACDDGIPCTLNECDEATHSCFFKPKNALCDNGRFCDGYEICDRLLGCLPGTPPNCDDGVACTVDTCSDAKGVCIHTPDDSFCNDHLFCNGVEYCNRDRGCLQGPPPNCDDGIACTVDSCNETTDQCDHTCKTPGITCPFDRTFECDAVGDFGTPTVQDDCSDHPVVVCTEVVTPGKLPQEERIVRTCTVTNSCGNTASCSQHVNVVDTTPPVVICPPDMTFQCDAIGDYGQPTVTDNCDPAPDVTIEVVTVAGDCRHRTVAGISPPPKLSVTRTITASDGSAAVATGNSGGNVAHCVQHIDIIDTHPPLLHECSAGLTVCVGDVLGFAPPTCSEAAACGTCDVICTRSDGQPLGNPVSAGSLTVTCHATDECGNNSAACNIPVQVQNCHPDIPTVSEWGLVVLALLLLIGAKIRFGRDPAAA